MATGDIPEYEVIKGFPGELNSISAKSSWPASIDWDRHRQRITQLYLHEANPLREVKRLMESEHGFKATERMFKQHISKWQLNKKNKFKAEEMKAALRKMALRRSDGKTTSFMLRGHTVEMEDVARYFKRRGIKVEDSISRETSPAVTPLALQCFTPEPLSSEADETLDGTTLCDSESPMTDFQSSSSYTYLHQSQDHDPKGFDNFPQVTGPSSRRASKSHYPSHQNIARFHSFFLSAAQLAIEEVSVSGDDTGEVRDCRNALQEFFEILGTALKYLDQNQFKAAGSSLEAAFSTIRQFLVGADSLIFANLIKLSFSLHDRGRPDIWHILSKHVREMIQVMYAWNHPMSDVLARLDRLNTHSSTEAATAALRSLDYHIGQAIVSLHWRTGSKLAHSFGQESQLHSCDSAMFSSPSNLTQQPYLQARFSYLSKTLYHLDFREGDVIQICLQRKDGWWYGTKHDAVGWFPSTYCALLCDSPAGSESDHLVPISLERPGSTQLSYSGENYAPDLPLTSLSAIPRPVAGRPPCAVQTQAKSVSPATNSFQAGYLVKADGEEDRLKEDRSDRKPNDTAVAPADILSNTSSCTSSPCPSLTSNSVGSSDYTQSYTDDSFPGFTPGYHRKLLTLAWALVICWREKTQDNVGKSSSKFIRSCAPSSGEAATNPHSVASEHSTRQPSEQQVDKHRKRQSRQDDDDDDDGDEKGSRKRSKLNPPSSDEEVTLLACPFYKYDPPRYSEVNIHEKEYRGCSSVLLKDISRLKQHLYRVHCQPKYYCPNCYEKFARKPLFDTHVRIRPPCEAGEPLFLERITDEQQESIRTRQYRVTMAENWYSVFDIIFPNSTRPDSPYVENERQRAVRSYLGFFRQQIQLGLMRTLNLDEGGQQAVQVVLERSATLVLHRMALEGVPEAQRLTEMGEDLAPTNQSELNDFHEFNRAIGNFVPQLPQNIEQTRYSPSQSDFHGVASYVNAQRMEREPLAEYVTGQPAQMNAPLAQEHNGGQSSRMFTSMNQNFHDFPQQDDLDTSKPDEGEDLPAWYATSFCF